MTGISRALLSSLACQGGILRWSSGCHSCSEFEKIVGIIVKGLVSSPQSNMLHFSQPEVLLSRVRENRKGERDTSVLCGTKSQLSAGVVTQ